MSDENNDDYIINLHLNETFFLHDQHNKHLFQIRPTQDDNNNPIHWKIIYAGNQSYFIKSNNKISKVIPSLESIFSFIDGLFSDDLYLSVWDFFGFLSISLLGLIPLC